MGNTDFKFHPYAECKVPVDSNISAIFLSTGKRSVLRLFGEAKHRSRVCRFEAVRS
jgi:hypothetical protein